MLLFLKMAWRNIRRNLRRTLITLGAISFGLSAMIVFFGFVRGFHAQWIENTVRAYTGHIQIFKNGYHEDPDISKSIRGSGLVIKELEAEPALKNYTRRVEIQGLVSTAENSYGVLIRGIDPEHESKITAIKERIIKGEYLYKNEEKSVLVGYRLAKKLNANPGDKIVLMAQDSKGSLNSELFRLKGIFKMGAMELDSSFVFITLKNAQMLALLGDKVTEIALMAQDAEDVPPVAERLKRRLAPLGYEVYTWQELMPAIEEMIYLDNVFMYIILLIVLAVVSIGILNTVHMSLMERVREFGVMMAMGTKPYQIVILIMLESFMIGLLGIVFGVSLGIGANNIIAIQGINLSRWAETGGMELFAILSPIIYPRTDVWNVVWSCAMVFLTALIVSVYPALKAAKLKPVEAMHHV